MDQLLEHSTSFSETGSLTWPGDHQVGSVGRTESLASTCYCLPSDGLKSMHLHTQLSYRGSGAQTEVCLSSKYFSKGAISLALIWFWLDSFCWFAFCIHAYHSFLANCNSFVLTVSIRYKLLI